MDHIVLHGTNAFENPSLEIDLNHIADDLETVVGIHKHSSNRSYRLPLWQACMEYKLMSIDRFVELEKSASDQGGFESKLLRRRVVLESALSCGLCESIKQYITAQTDESNINIGVGDEPKFVLEDVGNIEKWIKDCKESMEIQITNLFSGHIVPYLLKKTALNYARASDQYSSLPISVSSELTLRLGFLKSIETILAALHRRKCYESSSSSSCQMTSKTMTNNRSFGSVSNGSSSLFGHLGGSMSMKTTSILPSTTTTTNPAMYFNAGRRSMVSSGFATTTAQFGSTNRMMMDTSSSVDAGVSRSSSLLAVELCKTSCWSKCLRIVSVLVKHPYLSLRCLTGDIFVVRGHRMESLTRSKFNEIYSLSNASIATAVVPSNETSILNILLERTNLFQTSPQTGDINTFLDGRSCNDWIKWLTAFLLLPMTVVNSHHHHQTTSATTTTSAAAAVTNAFLVVVYQMIDCLWISLAGDNASSVEDINDVNVNTKEHLKQVEELTVALCSAAELPIVYSKFVLLAWKIDANVDVECAVQDLTSPVLASVFRDDAKIVLYLINRCIYWEMCHRMGEERKSIQFSNRIFKYFSTFIYNSPVFTALNSPFGALLLLASSLRVDSWEVSYLFCIVLLLYIYHYHVRAYEPERLCYMVPFKASLVLYCDTHHCLV